MNLMAKLGLSAPADGTQTVVRTRDAVDDLSVCIESSSKAHPIKQSSFLAATDLAHLSNRYPLISLRKNNLAFFQWNRRSFGSMTARGGTDEPLLSSITPRISLLLSEPKTGRSPKILLSDRLAKRIATQSSRVWHDSPTFCYSMAAICLFLYFLNPVKAHAAWVYFPPDVSRIYASDITTYNVFTSPAGTMVFDSTLKRFVDIASLPLLSQPPLNPIMVGMPLISYGGVPLSLDPLNPANSVQIGKDFAEYGSYMLGVSVLGLFLGMSFGGLLGLIRKNTQVI